MTKGLRVERRFTTEGEDPYGSVEWSLRASLISNPDGSIVFEMTDAEIPSSWSQVAADIMVSKYFRKAGVPQIDAEGKPLLDDDGEPVLGPERSARQVIQRLASTWRWWGEEHGYFAFLFLMLTGICGSDMHAYLGHDARRPAIERERGHRHPAATYRHQPLEPIGVLPFDQRYRVGTLRAG